MTRPLDNTAGMRSSRGGPACSPTTTRPGSFASVLPVAADALELAGWLARYGHQAEHPEWQ
jgi:hypothetical protein